MLLFIFFLPLPPLFQFPLYYFSFLVSTKFTLSDGTPPQLNNLYCVHLELTATSYTCRGLPMLDPPSFSMALCTVARVYPAHVPLQGVLGKTYLKT